MYETKKNASYLVYNSTINPSTFDWKNYDPDVQFNSHSLLEKRFDLSDITMVGTEDSMKSMVEVINRLQVRVNNTLIKYDAWYRCKTHNKTCKLTESKSDIFNSFINFKYKDYGNLNKTG